MRRALKHTFAYTHNNTQKHTNDTHTQHNTHTQHDTHALIGLGDSYKSLCKSLDTMMIQGVRTYDAMLAPYNTHTHMLQAMVDMEKCCGFPGAPTVCESSSYDFDGGRRDALRTLASEAECLQPCRVQSRSDTLPYNGSNHLRIVLKKVLQ